MKVAKRAVEIGVGLLLLALAGVKLTLPSGESPGALLWVAFGWELMIAAFLVLGFRTRLAAKLLAVVGFAFLGFILLVQPALAREQVCGCLGPHHASRALRGLMAGGLVGLSGVIMVLGDLAAGERDS